jgi:hypothetical protein
LGLIICFAIFCGINPVDDPDDPSDNGGGGGGGGTLQPGLVITDDGDGRVTAPEVARTARVDEIITVRLRLFADTASNAAPIRNGRITVIEPDGGGYWISNNTLTTDGNGWATLEFMGEREGTFRLTFEYINTQHNTRTTARVRIEVTDNPDRNITITAFPSVLPADGVSKSAIAVQVRNEFNNPIVGDTIRFSTEPRGMGMITASGVTDADGRAMAELTSDRRNGIANVIAFLASDPETSTMIEVEFSGVTLSVSATPGSIKPDGSEESAILAVLRDAANNPIVGERVTFASVRGAGTDIIIPEAVTNSRGEARSRVRGTESGHDVIAVVSPVVNVSNTVGITFSSHTISISPLDDHRHVNQTSQFNVCYMNDQGAGVSGATLYMSVTMGDVHYPPDNEIFTKQETTGEDGCVVFTMTNPAFASRGTISARAEHPILTTGSHDIEFLSSNVARIEITGSPAVININGNRARITATAFDAQGNRVNGAHISFNIRSASGLPSGPSGGAFLEPATARTGSDGTATTDLVSGSVPSGFRDVLVTASDFAGAPSDTARFTFAGPPHSIAINRNIDAVSAQSATYSNNMVALVADVNGNPVAETEVSFSIEITGYAIYRFRHNAYTLNGERVIDIDTVYRVIDSEWLDMSRPYNPFPRFDDINWSGVPERWSPTIGHPHNRGLMNNPIKPCHTPVIVGTGDDERRIECEDGLFADYDGTGIWDTVKVFFDWVDPDMLDALYDAGHLILARGYRPLPGETPWDLNWIGDGGFISGGYKSPPEPHGTVLIERTVTTKDGIAENAVVYGQSVAGRYRVRVWAECQGLVTSNPEIFVLPVSEGARNWNPKN